MSKLISSPLRSLLMSGAAIFHGLLLLLALVYLVKSIALGAPMVNGKLSPSFFPLIIGLLATVLCAWQFVDSIFFRVDDTATEASEGESSPVSRNLWLKPEVMLIAVTGLYVMGFTTSGYWLSTLLFVWAVMLLFSGIVRWMTKGLMALAITALGYLLFSQIFNVRLPLFWG